MSPQSHARTRQHAGSAADADLAGYGDLSAFDVRLSRAVTSDDEQVAVDLIMGGEKFLVGDGTLEFPLREEDRDLEPPASLRGRGSSTGPPVGESLSPGDGDQVARSAVAEALARLESLAGASRDAPDPVQERQSTESSEAGRDDLGDDAYIGMGGDFGSEAPTPFALPKLPGSHSDPPFSPASAPPPAHGSSGQGRPATTERPLSSPVSGALPKSPRATTRTPEEAHAESSARGRDGAIDARPEEFAPFEIRRGDGSAISEAFDSRSAEIPSYARTPERPTSGMPAADSDLTDFLPPTSGGISDTAAPERPAAPDYAAASASIDTEPLATSEHGRAGDEMNEEPDHTHTGPSDGPETLDPPEVADGASPPAARRSFLAQYRNILFAIALALLLMGVKHYTRVPADEAAAPVKTTAPVTSASAQRESVRARIEQPISALLPPAPAATRQAASSVIDHDQATASPQQFGADPQGAPALNEGLQGQLAELSQRLSTLESERNRLREENAALKRKPAAQKPRKAIAESHAAANVDSLTARPEASPNIQYLGTFRDADRLIAEVLFDGSLTRVKRGDVVDEHRVEAVGDMSVTIDGITYAP